MSTSTVAPFDLPSVLVPPEVIELEVLSTESSEDAPIKREEWPEYMLRLFDNDVLEFQVSLVVDLHISPI
jgi:nuclear cap-binding protein subunit 1